MGQHCFCSKMLILSLFVFHIFSLGLGLRCQDCDHSSYMGSLNNACKDESDKGEEEECSEDVDDHCFLIIAEKENSTEYTYLGYCEDENIAKKMESGMIGLGGDEGGNVLIWDDEKCSADRMLKEMNERKEKYEKENGRKLRSPVQYTCYCSSNYCNKDSDSDNNDNNDDADSSVSVVKPGILLITFFLLANEF